MTKYDPRKERLTPEQIHNLEEFIQEEITGTANEWVGQGRQREADFIYSFARLATMILNFAKPGDKDEQDS